MATTAVLSLAVVGVTGGSPSVAVGRSAPHGLTKPRAVNIPRTVNIHGQGTLLIIGDSLTVGSNAFGALATKARRLTYDGIPMWNKVVLDAKVGRTVPQGIKVLNTRLQKIDDVTAIVIALGTNDMISRRDSSYPARIIDEMMLNTGDIPVMWTNLEYSPTGRGDWRFRGRRFNRALTAAAREWPTLIVSDWATAFTPKGASRFIADGVHLTATGYRTRASHTLSQLRQFGTSLILATTTTTSSTTTSTTVAESTTTSTLESSTTSSSTTTIGSDQ